MTEDFNKFMKKRKLKLKIPKLSTETADLINKSIQDGAVIAVWIVDEYERLESLQKSERGYLVNTIGFDEEHVGGAGFAEMHSIKLLLLRNVLRCVNCDSEIDLELFRTEKIQFCSKCSEEREIESKKRMEEYLKNVN